MHHPERHCDPALQVLAAHPAGALRSGEGSSLLSVLDPIPEWISIGSLEPDSENESYL